MLSSVKCSVLLCQVYARIETLHGRLLKSEDKADRDKFRTEFLNEAVASIPSLKTAERVAAKLASLKKAGFIVPTLPEGIRGRKVKAEDKAAANAEAVAIMATVGKAPKYDADGLLLGWVDADAEV